MLLKAGRDFTWQGGINVGGCMLRNQDKDGGISVAAP